MGLIDFEIKRSSLTDIFCDIVAPVNAKLAESPYVKTETVSLWTRFKKKDKMSESVVEESML